MRVGPRSHARPVEALAQHADVRSQVGRCGSRRLAFPERVGDQVGRHEPVRMKQQGRQHLAWLDSGDKISRRNTRDLQGSEYPECDVAHRASSPVMVYILAGWAHIRPARRGVGQMYAGARLCGQLCKKGVVLRMPALSKVAVISLVAASGVMAPGTAWAEDARPAFQMPFPCNEVRQGATYAGHGGPGNHYPIDFNRGSDDEDLGDPVLASAAGRVRTWVEGDGDTVVQIVHNSTWASETHHHMTGSVTVSDGDIVEQGDRIGRVGKTGRQQSAHLHYEQLKNGVPVHLHFDGAPLNPGYSFQYNGPDYRSKNCSTAVDLSVSGVTDADGSVTVFARRGGSLWTKNRRNDGAWGDWVNRGGDLASGPDAAVTAAGFYHVVARGANGKVMYRRQGAEGWGDWHLTFSDFDSPFAPAIVAVDGNTLIAFAVRASDRALMKRRYDGAGGWEANWSRLGDGDGWTSGPDASLRDGGRVDLVIRGSGGRVNHMVRGVDGAWSPPQAMGELVTEEGVAPATASRKVGTVDLMARGESGYLWRNTLGETGWSGWERVFIGQLNQGPDLVADTGVGELQLLGRDTDGRIVRAVWNPGQGWTNLIPIPTN